MSTVTDNITSNFGLGGRLSMSEQNTSYNLRRRGRPSIHKSWNTSDDEESTGEADIPPEGANISGEEDSEVDSGEESEDDKENDLEGSKVEEENRKTENYVVDQELKFPYYTPVSVPVVRQSKGKEIFTKPPVKDPVQGEFVVQKGIIGLMIGFLFFVCMLFMSDSTNTTASNITIESIKKEFPTQDQDIWSALEAGVMDVVSQNRPSTFILLYNEEAEHTVSKLVKQLSEYATCNISCCEKSPIVVSDEYLNSPSVVRDYGVLIETFRDELRETGVMVIKNLQNVRGVSAQAFHSFCDEFTPLVNKSLFIFTMKVDELPRNKMKFVEEYFKKKWTDIKPDTLNALITRITSMVLAVRVEQR